MVQKKWKVKCAKEAHKIAGWKVRERRDKKLEREGDRLYVYISL